MYPKKNSWLLLGIGGSCTWLNGLGVLKMICFLSNLPNHEVLWSQKQSIAKRKWCILDQVRAWSEGTRKIQKQVVWMALIHSLLSHECPFLNDDCTGSGGGDSWLADAGEKRPSLFAYGSAWSADVSWKQKAAIFQSHQGLALEDSAKEKPSQGAKLWAASLVTHLVFWGWHETFRKWQMNWLFIRMKSEGSGTNKLGEASCR